MYNWITERTNYTLESYINAEDLQRIENNTGKIAEYTKAMGYDTEDVIQAVASGTIKGRTIDNAVVNPDFANGTAGWTAQSSTHSVTNKVLSNIGNGGGMSPFEWQEVQIINQASKKIKAGCSRVRVTNSMCTSIKIQVYTEGFANLIGYYDISTPTINTWYDLSSIISLTGGTVGKKIRILFVHNYADAATANGKVMEIDGNAGVAVIDMGTSASDPLYNKTNAEMNAMIGGALQNGLNSVSGLKVLSTGKNLFDIANKGTSGSYNSNSYTDGNMLVVNTINPAISGAYRCFKIKLKPNTQYKIKADSTRTGTSGGGINIYDDAISKIISAYPNTLNPDITFTTDYTGKTSILFYAKTGGTSADSATFTNIQLEEGLIATAYEPYISSEFTLPDTLRGLPNGVADTIVLQNGEAVLTKNVQEHILVSGDIGLSTTPANTDRVTINIPADAYLYANRVQSIASSNTVSVPNFRSIITTTDVAADIGGLYNSASLAVIVLVVAKGTYANLAAAQTALAGTKIQYQLATPVITSTPTDFVPIENGTISQSGSPVNAELVNIVPAVKVNWANTLKIPFRAEMQRMIDDISFVGNLYETPPFLPSLPSIPENLRNAKYDGMNAIESYLKILYDYLQKQKSTFKYSGQLYAGQDVTYL